MSIQNEKEINTDLKLGRKNNREYRYKIGKIDDIPCMCFQPLICSIFHAKQRSNSKSQRVFHKYEGKIA